MIAVTMKTTTKRLIIHEAESTHKYHHKYPLEIHSTRKKNWNKRLTKHLGNLKKTLVKLQVISRWPCAHAPNKQGGKPASQDTSSYTSWRKWRYAFQCNLSLNCFEVHDFSIISMLFFADCVTIHYINQTMYWNPILKWLTLFVTMRNWLKIKIHSLTAILFPTFVGESEFNTGIPFFLHWCINDPTNGVKQSCCDNSDVDMQHFNKC